MALPDLLDRRRREQPLRKPLFTHASSRRGKQLEQTAPTEQVKIRGVDMMRIVEALSGLPGAGPAIGNAGEPVAIEGGGALRQISGSQNPRMIYRDPDEQDRGHNQPGGREPVFVKRRPSYRKPGHEQRQPKVAKTDMNFLVASDSSFAVLETLLVFLGRRHSLEDISRAGANPCVQVFSGLTAEPGRLPFLY